MMRKLIGIKELSEYLDIKIGTVYLWTYQKRIPYVKIGRLTKFDIEEIDEWINKHKVKQKYMY